MMPETLEYLAQYQQQLQKTKTPASVHTTLADWLWNNFGRIQPLVEDLNESLRLKDKKRFQNHIPTVAVGPLNGLLFVSANPGFSKALNCREQAFRMKSEANNRQFCAEFFKVFPQKVGANSWWYKAIGFAHLVETGKEARLDRDERWAWAATNGGLANVDLLPFHSTADGFGCMSGQAEAHQALRQTAFATLTMLMNLHPAPRLIFIASSGGASLLKRYHDQLGLMPVQDLHAPFAPHFIWYRHKASGQSVAVFARQIFSGNFTRNRPTDFTWEDLANPLRRESAVGRPAENEITIPPSGT